MSSQTSHSIFSKILGEGAGAQKFGSGEWNTSTPGNMAKITTVSGATRVIHWRLTRDQPTVVYMTQQQQAPAVLCATATGIHSNLRRSLL